MLSRRWLLAFLLLIMAGLVVWVASLFRTSSPSETLTTTLTTNTYSSMFATKEERITFLKNYVKLETDVEDAVYHLTFHDNSAGLIPGPSDWAIQVILKTTPHHVVAWTKNLEPSNTLPDLAWSRELMEQAGWTLESPVSIYNADDKTVLIYQDRTLVFLNSTTF
jgi:hypothetical protein